MTNIRENHYEMLSLLDQFHEDVTPLKERFYNFIVKNPCKDIPCVPDSSFYGLVPDKNDENVPLPVEHFHIEIPIQPLSKEDKASQPTGVSFHAEFEAEDEFGDELTDEGYFSIPYEYFDNPDAWEADVLARIERRRVLARKMIEIVCPEAPEEIIKEVDIMWRYNELPQLFVTLIPEIAQQYLTPSQLKAGTAVLGLDIESGDVYVGPTRHTKAGIDTSNWDSSQY